jgi:hypothetical protein
MTPEFDQSIEKAGNKTLTNHVFLRMPTQMLCSSVKPNESIKA